MPAHTILRTTLLLSLLVVALTACGDQPSAANEPAAAQSADPALLEEATGAEEIDAAAAETPEQISRLLQPWHGDFDAMVERRVIRVLVTYNKTNFFLDRGHQRGIVAEALRELEKALNQQLKLGARPLHVAAIPVSRDQLLSFLEQGRGDMAVASLTITPDRQRLVDFSAPTNRDVSELVVTGPGGPPLASVDDLAGKQVLVRPSSSYWQSLQRLNESFRSRGLQEVVVEPASEYLETEDLLEMVNAGLVPITIADDYLARFWAQIFPALVVHEDLAVASGEQIAWGIRRDATGLKAQIDPFIEANRVGTLLGNVLVKRYLKNTSYVRNSLDDADRERFRQMVDIFRKYAAEYDFDFLMVAAQGYQESRLDQSVVSPVGAIGVMQVMPTTATDPAVGIPNIHELDANIHAGTKYLRVLVDRYFDDPGLDPVNRTLFAFAGYNGGPNRINRLRQKAAEMGYDPNVWFRNVELVVAADVGREPVQYVSNIYKYYIVYRILVDQMQKREEAKGAVS